MRLLTIIGQTKRVLLSKGLKLLKNKQFLWKTVSRLNFIKIRVSVGAIFSIEVSLWNFIGLKVSLIEEYII